MKKFVLSLIVLIVVVSSTHAAIIFNDDCDDLSLLSGSDYGRVNTSTGKFVFSGANADSNIQLFSSALSLAAGDTSISFDSLKFATPYNMTTSYIFVGLSQGLAVKLTSYGDGSKLVYNGVDYALDNKPRGIDGNVSLTLEYFNNTNRVVATQISGKYKNINGTTVVANNTVIFDQVMSSSLDFQNYNVVRLFGNTQWNGGYVTGSAVDNIVVSNIPEPATISLLVCGMAVLCGRKNKHL